VPILLRGAGLWPDQWHWACSGVYQPDSLLAHLIGNLGEVHFALPPDTPYQPMPAVNPVSQQRRNAMMLSTEQRIQEAEYTFPYHHIMTTSLERGRFEPYIVYAFAHRYYRYVSLILEMIGESDFESLMDIGCGDGFLLSCLAKRYPEATLTGIDYSQRAMRFAKAFDASSRYVVADVMDPSQVLGEVDIVTSVHVWEHIPPADLPGFAEAHARALKPKGRLILSVPLDNIRLQDKHYQHFSEAKLRELLAPTLEITKARYVNSTRNRVNRLIMLAFRNKWFMIKHPAILNWLYRMYVRLDSSAGADDAAHIVIEARRIA
jgi:2-polyprenyl-3-methyl-5-hydroxy-6-metoxy-1,4-benzoquinol methylase